MEEKIEEHFLNLNTMIRRKIHRNMLTNNLKLQKKFVVVANRENQSAEQFSTSSDTTTTPTARVRWRHDFLKARQFTRISAAPASGILALSFPKLCIDLCQSDQQYFQLLVVILRAHGSLSVLERFDLLLD